MLRKLPWYLVGRWGCEVDRWLSKEFEVPAGENGVHQMRSSEVLYPPLSALCEFLKRGSRIILPNGLDKSR